MERSLADLAGRTALVMLAAGRASRFGSPKLEAPLQGIPLVHHAAHGFADIPFAYRLCVATQGGVDLVAFGYDMVTVKPGLPMGRSLAAGTCAAAALGVEAVMIALGDMPLVPADHIRNLLARFDGSVVASFRDGIAMPPAIFGSLHFSRLTSMEEDEGARSLLGSALLVETDARQLIDIDTPADLILAQTLGDRPVR